MPLRSLAAVMLVPLLAGCSREGVTSIRLVVKDGQIRAPGDECAGAGPFLYAHARARYAIHDRDGVSVVDGQLPAGRAVDADPTIDWSVPRVPTFCVLRFEVDGLDPGSYRLLIADGPPLRFSLPGDRDEEGAVTIAIP